MKIGRNLSNSLLRGEVFNRANKSFGTSIGLSFWRRSRLLIGFVLCSVSLLLALAGLSQSVTGTFATRRQRKHLVRGRRRAASPPRASLYRDAAARRQGARRWGVNNGIGTSRERGTL